MSGWSTSIYLRRKTHMQWRVVLVILLIFICLINGKHHLVQVHMLFRHGDRSSIVPFPFDGYDPSAVWPEGYGQLTQVGIEQQFLLGLWLTKYYENFMSPSYNVSTFHMRSSDIDRALMSAEAMMAGFFHGSETSLEKYGLHWRPVPTHTVPLVGLNLLKACYGCWILNLVLILGLW